VTFYADSYTDLILKTWLYVCPHPYDFFLFTFRQEEKVTAVALMLDCSLYTIIKKSEIEG
jgi:hypothetical protein